MTALQHCVICCLYIMLLLPKTVFIGENLNVIIICLRSVLHACHKLYNFAIFIHGSQKPTHKTKGSELCIYVCVCVRVRVSEG